MLEVRCDYFGDDLVSDLHGTQFTTREVSFYSVVIIAKVPGARFRIYPECLFYLSPPYDL